MKKVQSIRRRTLLIFIFSLGLILGGFYYVPITKLIMVGILVGVIVTLFYDAALEKAGAYKLSSEQYE